VGALPAVEAVLFVRSEVDDATAVRASALAGAAVEELLFSDGAGEGGGEGVGEGDGAGQGEGVGGEIEATVLRVLSGSLQASLRSGRAVRRATAALAAIARRTMGRAAEVEAEAIAIAVGAAAAPSTSATKSGVTANLSLPALGLHAALLKPPQGASLCAASTADAAQACDLAVVLFGLNVHAPPNTTLSAAGRAAAAAAARPGAADADVARWAAWLGAQYGGAAAQLPAAFGAAPGRVTPVLAGGGAVGGAAVTGGPVLLQLASGVLRVAALPPAAALLTSATTEAAATPPPPPPAALGEGAHATLSLRAAMPAAGRGACSAHEQCYGGVCCRGACRCTAGHVGRHCEFRVACARWSDGDGGGSGATAGRWDASACSAAQFAAAEPPAAASDGDDAGGGGNRSAWAGEVVCACPAGEVAVTLTWEQRWLPEANFVVPRPVRPAALLRHPAFPLLASGLLLLPALLCAAHCLDRRTLHVREPPRWLVPPPAYSFRRRFWLHLRLRHPALKVVSVVPVRRVAASPLCAQGRGVAFPPPW